MSGDGVPGGYSVRDQEGAEPVPAGGRARVALAQLHAGPLDAAGSRDRSVRAARDGFEGGADLVVLPELVVPGYATDPELLREAGEPLDGETVAAWQGLAADAGGFIAGGLCERDGDALFNSAVLVGSEGILLHYRKLHLFADEKKAFRPGDLGMPVARTRLGVLGLCICYDLRFVETLRILALRGAELVCVPTAWLPGFDSQSWDADGFSPQARSAVLQANLSQVFVAAASQAGTHDGRTFLGSSILADPSGELAVGPLSRDEERIVVAELDLGEAHAARTRGSLITPREDRRTDVYRLAIDSQLL